MVKVVRARPRLLAAALAGAAAFVLWAPSGAESEDKEASVAAMPRIGGTRAGENVLKLGYQVYLGGLNAFAFTVDVALNDDSYWLSGVGESRGLTRLMWKWAAALKAGGTLGPEGMNAQIYNVDTRSRRGDKALQLSFESQGNYSIQRTPPDDEYRKSKRELPDFVPARTVDPLSVSLRVARAVGDGRGCNGTYPIFDGDRRYDLTFTDLGVENLEPTPYSVFAGAATRCRFDIKRIMGFRDQREGTREKRSSFRYWDEDGLRPPEVWVGRVVRDMPPVPVRMHGDLSMGGLRIYLVWAEYAGRPVYRNGERPVLNHAGGK